MNKKCPTCKQEMVLHGHLDTAPIPWQLEGASKFPSERYCCPRCHMFADYTMDGILMGYPPMNYRPYFEVCLDDFAHYVFDKPLTDVGIVKKVDEE